MDLPKETNRQVLQKAIHTAVYWAEQHTPERSSQGEAITEFLQKSGYQVAVIITKDDLQETIYQILGMESEDEPEPEPTARQAKTRMA